MLIDFSVPLDPIKHNKSKQLYSLRESRKQPHEGTFIYFVYKVINRCDGDYFGTGRSVNESFNSIDSYMKVVGRVGRLRRSKIDLVDRY